MGFLPAGAEFLCSRIPDGRAAAPGALLHVAQPRTAEWMASGRAPGGERSVSDYSDAARGWGCPGAPPSRLQQRPRVARRICTGRRPTQGAPGRWWQRAWGRSTGWPGRGKALLQARLFSVALPLAVNSRWARSASFAMRASWKACRLGYAVNIRVQSSCFARGRFPASF